MDEDLEKNEVKDSGKKEVKMVKEKEIKDEDEESEEEESEDVDDDDKKKKKKKKKKKSGKRTSHSVCAIPGCLFSSLLYFVYCYLTIPPNCFLHIFIGKTILL